MIDPITKGREAILDGKHYRVLDVDPAQRKLTLRQIRKGELDPPPVPPAVDLRDGAHVYIQDQNRILSCVVTDDTRALSKEFVTVALVAHGIVGERFDR